VIHSKHQQRCLQFVSLALFFLLADRSLAAFPHAQAPAPTASTPVSGLCVQAAAGDSSAIHRLNQYLLQQDTTAVDYAVALDCLRARAAHDHPDAEFLLGYLFEHGHGVPQDLVKAAANYQAASDRGDSFAQNNLASLYQRGLGVPRDPRKALDLYTASAQRGNAIGQTNLASLYYRGDGVPINVSEAARWFLAAADRGGDSVAQHNLGVLYYRGQGVPQDFAAAAKWIGRSASQGLPAAQADLGFLYETGAGVSQDEFAAYLWYSRASAAGDSDGAARRDAIAHRLSAKQRDEGRALAAAPRSTSHDALTPSPGELAILPKH
jgi:TPR repeat protein